MHSREIYALWNGYDMLQSADLESSRQDSQSHKMRLFHEGGKQISLWSHPVSEIFHGTRVFQTAHFSWERDGLQEFAASPDMSFHRLLYVNASIFSISVYIPMQPMLILDGKA